MWATSLNRRSPQGFGRSIAQANCPTQAQTRGLNGPPETARDCKKKEWSALADDFRTFLREAA